MDVTVIVPVFNPGPFIEPCVASLLAQSLPSDRYEVIFVDDGSTGETPQRLDEIAASHDNVVVRHQPNSGWSGGPRNVGLGLARGDYVFFCDHDDWLSPEALERMVAYARQTGADVLAPKIIGHQRGAPTIIFERNVADATFATTPLMFGCAPHKLFRRAFVEQHGLRFLEGRRFEDQVFVLEAYLLASRIAVLADYECYHHVRRADDSNAAFLPVDPGDYVRHVSEVIDVIEARTAPGPMRDVVMRRPFELELLGRFARRWFLENAPSYQRALLAAVSALINDRFPEGFGERSGAVTRVRAAAVRAGDFESVLALSECTAKLQGRAELIDLQWDGSGWRAELEAEMVLDDGSPVVLMPDGENAWRVDPRLLVDGMHTRPDSTTELLTARASVDVLGRATAVNWFAAGDVRAELGPVAGHPHARRLLLRGAVRFDPAALAGGRPLARDIWNVRVRIYAFGHSVTTRLRAAPDRASAARSVLMGSPAFTVVACFTGRHRNLAFQVRPATRAVLGSLLRHAVTAAKVNGNELGLDLDLDIAAAVEPVPLRMHLRAGGNTPAYVTGTLASSPAGAVLRASTSPSTVGGARRVPTGKFRLVVRSSTTAALGAYVVVGRRGRITSAGLTNAPLRTPDRSANRVRRALQRRIPAAVRKFRL